MEKAERHTNDPSSKGTRIGTILAQITNYERDDRTSTRNDKDLRNNGETRDQHDHPRSPT